MTPDIVERFLLTAMNLGMALGLPRAAVRCGLLALRWRLWRMTGSSEPAA